MFDKGEQPLSRSLVFDELVDDLDQVRPRQRQECHTAAVTRALGAASGISLERTPQRPQMSHASEMRLGHIDNPADLADGHDVSLSQSSRPSAFSRAVNRLSAALVRRSSRARWWRVS